MECLACSKSVKILFEGRCKHHSQQAPISAHAVSGSYLTGPDAHLTLDALRGHNFLDCFALSMHG